MHFLYSRTGRVGRNSFNSHNHKKNSTKSGYATVPCLLQPIPAGCTIRNLPPSGGSRTFQKHFGTHPTQPLSSATPYYSDIIGMILDGVSCFSIFLPRRQNTSQALNG